MASSPQPESYRYPEVKGILFDLDGTLYHQAPLRILVMFLFACEQVWKPRQLKRNTRVILEYRKALEKIRNMDPFADKSGQVTLTAENTGETPEYVTSVVACWMETKPLPWLKFFRRKGAAGTLAALRQRGLKLGVFSDYPVEEKLRALGLAQYFPVRISSADPEVTGFKPETDGFQVAAGKMGLRLSEMIYVGDRPEVDGIGAARAGAHPVILASKTKSKKGMDFPTVPTFKKLLEIL